MQSKSTILNNIPLAPDLGDLQHERDFTQVKAWMQHWPNLTSEQSKVNFLMYLKQKRDMGDQHAEETLKTLTARWLEEKFIP